MSTDLLVFVVVVGLRLLVPLAVFRYPLPAIVAAMIVDGIDQTAFELLTDLDLTNYQSYDKSLDVYYLSLAYISTLRNWTSLFAFGVGKVLWYYRLVGIVLFELTAARWVLLVFPNTFEYFFIWYEAVRTRWNPLRLTTAGIVTAAALIWIFIKLPQEYWIHVAKLDATDFFRESILGASSDDSWGTAIGGALWIIPVVIVLAVAAVVFGRMGFKRLPAPDWNLTLDSDRNADQQHYVGKLPLSERHWNTGLLEKVILVGLVTLIFAEMLPGVETSVLELIVGVGVVVSANAFVSHFLATRGREWRSLLTEFFGLTVINLIIASVYIWLLPLSNSIMPRGALIFAVMLLTLIVTCYDRYNPIHDHRVSLAKRAERS